MICFLSCWVSITSRGHKNKKPAEKQVCIFRLTAHLPFIGITTVILKGLGWQPIFMGVLDAVFFK